ncbi:reverse transcriptase domain-containing protein [Pseudonocardia sp. Cha107L01]|uniref:reverse transcriptase domain-containing protein n=1 Tax=Pseudonocardia sp. Cha107L01 TaxID=3457576 RepID=UPI00403EBF14
MEARFEIRSYGFRRGRGCHEAIEAIFNTLHGRNAQRLSILDADLTAAFDRIDHSQLLAVLGSFPGKETTRQWLTAGVFEPGKGFAPTQEGTPQGGLCSAAHKPPYEQCRVMRSAGLPALVTATLGVEHCA